MLTGGYLVGHGTTTSTRARAPGLDGVRALAVLAVMGFHEGASELSGGFLGVDIFFVLSGFLITDLLAAGYDRSGRLDLKDFWVRRARRLLPALAVMLIVVTAAATLIEPGQEASLRLALLAAVTYTSNWYQILHHISYFAASGLLMAPPPLDHLWSLAIEEQFYLIWPLILWLVIFRLNERRARTALTLLAAAMSALAMALQYTPGGDPSPVYYGTYTHASALLIGAALAVAWPLPRLASIPAHTRRLDAVGVAGIAVLSWASGHFSGSDPAVYPVGLVLAALGAAGLIAAAAGNGVIAAITSLPPLRWLGVRSYGIYLWHWPVIALTAAVAGPGSSSPWLWFLETGITIVVASASWRFIEAPILRSGLRATCRHWLQALVDVGTRQRPGRAVLLGVAALSVFTFATASYGISRPAGPGAPNGLLRQVADGEQITHATQSPRMSRTTKPTTACRQAPAKVRGAQVTAVGDSVMLASAAALQKAMPGIYIDAQLDRQMGAGLGIVRELAAGGALRRVVVVALGTNGTVTASQVRALQRAVGPRRELVLVNTFGPQSWEAADNAVLAAAARRSPHVRLADWNQAIIGRPEFLWPDGIHPRPAGARLYARVVLTAIRAAPSSGRQPRC